jgi:hypothetical protein
VKGFEDLLIAKDKDGWAQDHGPGRIPFSSVHTVDHFRLKPPGRSRYSAWSAFHLSTAIITTTRVIWFQKLFCSNDGMLKTRSTVRKGLGK